MNRRSLSISGIAHDLNNQIMILFHALDQMMREHSDNPDLAIAIRALEQCAQLTSQLLPQKKKNVPSLSICQVAAETALLVRGLLPACNRLEVDCPADCVIPGVLADIQQALVNLCLNAIQAMDGPGVIRLVVTREIDGILLCVSDTGPGVPLEMRQQIFDPLFTTRAERGGHGLGLARVREIVERMGGSVEVGDASPRGACFRIRLPLPSVTLEFADLSD